MFKTHAHRTMDMTEGSLLAKVLFFSLPIMLSGILQLLFNAADTIVVGRFAGNEALAAVGSVGSLNNMIISLFVGLSIGVNVLVARFTGAKDAERVSETVHTAVLLSLVGGAVLAVVGFAAARPLLASTTVKGAAGSSTGVSPVTSRQNTGVQTALSSNINNIHSVSIFYYLKKRFKLILLY